MRVQSPSDAVYTLIAKLPLLIVVVAAAWVLMSGAAGLERISFGSEFFVKNSETSNLPPQLPSQTDALQAALASGDVDEMSAALDRYEAQGARGTTGIAIPG